MTLDRIAERLREHHLLLREDRQDAIQAYVELLVRWNRKVNLTGFSFDGDTDAAIERLLLEPLAAAKLARTAARVLDVGSGGGSPAIPFVLGLDGVAELVMVESRRKKAVFLGEALRAARIPGGVLATRYEEVAPQERFDVITVRAVAAEASLWDLVHRALLPNGRLFWFHSGAQAQPIQDVLTWDPPRRLLDGDSRVSIGHPDVSRETSPRNVSRET